MLCKDCKNCKKDGEFGSFYCDIPRADGSKMRLSTWKTTPHPLCPLLEMPIAEMGTMSISAERVVGKARYGLVFTNNGEKRAYAYFTNAEHAREFMRLLRMFVGTAVNHGKRDADKNVPLYRHRDFDAK